MRLQKIQGYSVRAFQSGERIAARIAEWIRNHPRLAAWVFDEREVDADDDYRQFNLWYFAQYAEQERMLADEPRMRFYHTMIERHIRPGDRVIDLGTGTGILAAFASRQGAAVVYALDHSAIIEEARLLAAHNQIRNVDFIAMHSREFKLEEPVDVILHEQMGDLLFDEDMVANVTDLRDRLLKPGGRILPSRFELYCEPVRVKEARRVPFIWELNVHGFDYAPMEDNRPEDPDYYYLRSDDPSLLECFLGEPTPVLEVDLETIQKTHLPLEISFSCTIREAGRLDGFAVYFRALVDDDLSLSSDPLDPGRAPHWGFRLLRTEECQYDAGDVIEVTLSADHWPDPHSWRWNHERVEA